MDKKKQLGNNFLVQGGILALAGIIVRFIGMFYRVPLTHIIGDRGNSLYDTAYSVYSIILIISSYSLPVAISKLLAQEYAKGQVNQAKKIFRCALVYAIVVGAVASLLCYFGAPYFVKSQAAIPVLQTLSPVIFFSAILGTYRGFFQGHRTMVPTSISQIIEQIFNAIISVLAAYLLVKPLITNDPMDMLPTRGAMGSTLGTGAGVVAGLLFIFGLYLKKNKQYTDTIEVAQVQETKSYREILKLILFTVTPMVLSAALYNVSPFIDNYMIYGVMDANGYAPETIQSMHGIYTGKYLLMVNIPVAIANALASALQPSVAASKSKGDQEGLLSKANLTLKATMIIAVPCTVGMGLLGGPLIQMIFGVTKEYENLPGQLMLYGSSFILFFAVSTVTNALLQATDYLKAPVVHSAIALVVHVILAYGLMNWLDLGVWALMISTVAFALLLCILNFIVLYRKVKLKVQWKQVFFKPFIASLGMGIAATLTYYGIYKISNHNTLAFLLALGLAIILYFVLLFAIGGLTKEELLAMPKGAMLVRLGQKLHLFS